MANPALAIIRGIDRIRRGATVLSINAAGNAVLSAGKLIMSAAASQIVPGATSWAVRNTADGANNILILDDGTTTLRKYGAGVAHFDASGNVTSSPIVSADITDGTMVNADIATSADIAVSKLRQYEFSAKLNTGTTNQTGDGTTYVVPLDTEVTDDGGNFASNQFTAPVTGCYQLNALVSVGGLGAGHTQILAQITTSNRAYRIGQVNGANARDSGNTVAIAGSVLADMDAGDVAYIDLTVSGSTKTVGVNGHATLTLTTFSGFLAA